MIKNRKSLEIYIHIPFCKKKCLYCDFLSFAKKEEKIQEYLEALIAEIVGKATRYKSYLVKTVFIGGGTPSILEPNAISRIITSLKENYNLISDCEITMEVNPGTTNFDNLVMYKKAGINRLSMGLQSANDRELKLLGRIHTRSDFESTYQSAREAGFENINVDIISAIPDQNMESYNETLNFLMELVPRPEHISAYSLIIEEGTPFYDMDNKNMLRLPDEDEERKMYEYTEAYLRKNGYNRYEISNYAKPGYECKHNVGYWIRTEYVGFGIGAASLIGNKRFNNSRDIDKYILSPLECESDVQILSKRDEQEEFMFLGLRLINGVSFKDFEEIFHENLAYVYGDVIEKNVKAGLLRIEKDSLGDERIALTKKGLDLSNYVFAQFLFD